MPTKSRRYYAFAVLVLPLAVGGLPVQAHAFAPGPPRSLTAAATAVRDVVNLRNGGMVLGQIVEILPGDSLTMVSTAGRSSTAAGASRFFSTALASSSRGISRSPTTAATW